MIQIQKKIKERSPPLKDNTIFLFCLIDIYLNEWILSRVRSTKLALDKIQSVRYFLWSRIEEIKSKLFILNIKRREVKKYGIKICNPKHGKDIRKFRICWRR